jgi:hypothetical protein
VPVREELAHIRLHRLRARGSAHRLSLIASAAEAGERPVAGRGAVTEKFWDALASLVEAVPVIVWIPDSALKPQAVGDEGCRFQAARIISAGAVRPSPDLTPSLT